MESENPSTRSHTLSPLGLSKGQRGTSSSLTSSLQKKLLKQLWTPHDIYNLAFFTLLLLVRQYFCFCGKCHSAFSLPLKKDTHGIRNIKFQSSFLLGIKHMIIWFENQSVGFHKRGPSQKLIWYLVINLNPIRYGHPQMIFKYHEILFCLLHLKMAKAIKERNKGQA